MLRFAVNYAHNNVHIAPQFLAPSLYLSERKSYKTQYNLIAALFVYSICASVCELVYVAWHSNCSMYVVRTFLVFVNTISVLFVGFFFFNFILRVCMHDCSLCRARERCVVIVSFFRFVQQFEFRQF